MEALFGGAYKGRRVLVTGHTGFKGSWLTLWLNHLGAHVAGYALGPETTPNHYDLLKPNIDTTVADIRDLAKLKATINEFQPEIVFHMAAQSLVRHGHAEPVETFATNVMGTVNLLEACRTTSSVQAIVNITSDKCYENSGSPKGFCESDPMGGNDPYSASKGCAELVTNAYRVSYFNASRGVLVASARAGNAVGGGDWATDRLIPDVMRAAALKDTVVIRNPKAIRPWQHVLEPLSGYLWLGAKLLKGDCGCEGGWNFGPASTTTCSVEEIVTMCQTLWEDIEVEASPDSSGHEEAPFLQLDCSKALKHLQWRPVWDIDTTLERTVNWYKAYYQAKTLLSSEDLEMYVNHASTKGLPWA